MSAEHTNPAGEVRPEDGFDAARVHAWLREHATGTYAERLGPQPPELSQFPGGASNLTYLLRYPDQDLILRRPPSGAKARGAHDMGREHRIQAALKPVFGLVPDMVAFCGDETVIGSEFYVMQRLDGTILRRDLPPELGLDAANARTLCTRALDVLVALHAVDVSAVPELAGLHRGDGYVARQVDGWTSRLQRAATDDLGDWTDITAWLAAEQPADVGVCLIHNDFRFDNLVLDPDDPLRIAGVLDWEMATVGDPLMDLSGALAYWIQADDDDTFQSFRRQPSNAPGMLTRAEVVDYYAEATGREMSPRRWTFYEVFGLFRLAVIAQQIWYRYYHGQTSNPAYAPFGPIVGYLEQRCRSVIRR